MRHNTVLKPARRGLLSGYSTVSTDWWTKDWRTERPSADRQDLGARSGIRSALNEKVIPRLRRVEGMALVCCSQEVIVSVTARQGLAFGRLALSSQNRALPFQSVEYPCVRRSA